MSKLGNRPNVSAVPNPDPLDKPELPPHPTGLAWTPYAVRYWDEVWLSEATSYWLRSDLLLLERCLLMVEQIAQGEATTATLSELRRTEEALYLSPGSRQRSRINTQPVGTSHSPGELDERAQRLEEQRERLLEGAE